jgi:hypothetical protein
VELVPLNQQRYPQHLHCFPITRSR